MEEIDSKYCIYSGCHSHNFSGTGLSFRMMARLEAKFSLFRIWFSDFFEWIHQLQKIPKSIDLGIDTIIIKIIELFINYVILFKIQYILEKLFLRTFFKHGACHAMNSFYFMFLTKNFFHWSEKVVEYVLVIVLQIFLTKIWNGAVSCFSRLRYIPIHTWLLRKKCLYIVIQ